MDRVSRPRRDEIRYRIEANLALVEHIVTRVAARLPAHVERDDLVQSGMLALVDSAGRFDPSRGVAFSTFAGRRIEGALLDAVRAQDWVSRSVRARAREVAAAEQRLQNRGERSPSEHVVADAAGITLAQLASLRQRVHDGVVVALDRPATSGAGADLGATIADEHAVDPLEQLEEAELKALVRTAIRTLPERQRLVVTGYYLQDRSIDQLATLLDVSPSRISQLKSDALDRIRGQVEAKYDEADTVGVRSTPLAPRPVVV